MPIDSPADAETVYRIATANRLLAADMFAALTPGQWRTPSLCAGWTVREVAAHLLEALETGVGTLKLLVSKPATKGFLPRDRLTGLRLVATDQDWRHGDGPEIIGSSEAIAMAVSGRPAALDDLAGPGLDVLRRRIAPSSPITP